jgi:metallo-beta-lactamase family protein
MKLSFHGATREVTGSCHLLEVNGRKILMDCGMFQGGKERHQMNRDPFPFDPKELDYVLLSHAHIDHSGRLPLLYKAGYRGPVLTTAPTTELVGVLLRDSGHIHEEDARWKIKRLTKQGVDSSWVTPLFTRQDADDTLDLLEAVPFNEDHRLEGVGTVRFTLAGHILGAAIIELSIDQPGGARRLVFTGDLGVEGARLLGPPSGVASPDYLLIESTYGTRKRTKDEDHTDTLFQIIDRTVSRGGKVVIPSFAVGRSQEILARINDLVEGGELDGLRVYLDSPMAVAATSIFEDHPYAYSRAARRALKDGDKPLEFPGLTLTANVQESIDINRSKEPCVIISASGMCTAGRIKHHLKHNLSNPKATILFVGYQAYGTLGSQIQSGKSPVRIFGEMHKVKAEVVTCHGYSAHADKDELLNWFEKLGPTPGHTFVVHGEEKTALAFADTLRQQYSARVSVPERGQEFKLD